MFKKNNIVTGFLAGLVLPVFSWVIFGYLLKNKPVIMNKPAIPYLAILAINLFVIKYLFKKGVDQTGSGMIVSTFTSMLLMFFSNDIFLR